MAQTIAKLIEAIEADANVSLSFVAKDEQERLVREIRCLICKKPLGKKIVRGCHEYCQRKAKDTYSERELEESGMLLPVEKAGRKPTLLKSIQSSLDPAREAKALTDKTLGRAKKRSLPNE